MANTESKIIGIDVGGTKILLQAFDKKLNLIEQIKVPTKVRSGRKGFLNQLFDVIDQVFHKGIMGIGIAVPGIVDMNKGTLVEAPHLPTGKHLPLRKLIQNRYKVPVIIDNDINGFLIAEKETVKLKKYKNIIALMLGTGLGGAIMVDGKMVYGKNGFAGEVGHIIVNAEGTLKTLEQNTSGHYIPKIAKILGIKRKFIANDLKKSTAGSKKVKRHIIDKFGIGLANLNLIFNPEVFVMGGSVYQNFLSNEKKQLERIVSKYSLDKSSPKIVVASQKTSVARGMAMEILNKKR